jgi:hypothetical protein
LEKGRAFLSRKRTLVNKELRLAVFWGFALAARHQGFMPSNSRALPE